MIHNGYIEKYFAEKKMNLNATLYVKASYFDATKIHS